MEFLGGPQVSPAVAAVCVVAVAAFGVWRIVLPLRQDLARARVLEAGLPEGIDQRGAKPAHPDAILSLLRRLDRLRLSWWFNLIKRPEDILDTNICGFGESCAFFMCIETEYEDRYSKSYSDLPASQAERIGWFSQALPTRPTPYQFKADRQEFPLTDTREIYTCVTCSGSGQVTCPTCSGDGRVKETCRSCGGKGYKESDDVQVHCVSCSGVGEVWRTCGRCRGSGEVTCRRCKGEGRLLRYRSTVFEFSSKAVKKRVLSADAERGVVQRRVDKVFSHEPGNFSLREFDTAEVGAHLGLMNPDMQGVTEKAAGEYRNLLRQTRERMGHSGPLTVLFQRHTKKVTPIGYVSTVIRQKYGQYWIIGTRDHFESVSPPIRLDGERALGWLLSMGTVGALVASLLVEPVLGYAALPFCGGSLWTMDRWAGRYASFRIDRRIAILGTANEDTFVFFSLVAHLVAYCRAGFVQDEYYPQLFHFLLGDGPRPGLSASYRLLLDGNHAAETAEYVRVVNLCPGALERPTQDVYAVLCGSDEVWILVADETGPDPYDASIAQMLQVQAKAHRRATVLLIMDAVTGNPPDFCKKRLPRTMRALEDFEHSCVALDVEGLRDTLIAGEARSEGELALQLLNLSDSPQYGTADSAVAAIP